ncbi:Hint domain-containing protein [Acetobacter farinalis]|uniref:Hint domain-containing protein n=1 Tax=Acetobacter farinalis TaxID=1260984 RepID=A0ABT3Q8D4_9PROT|nr:Hint domain-containing protein [Acetobacter farinalis]MCX2561548.1 Hint domain-containing protein [Acetobacter farinalis]NHO30765.1 hypothetical protein [Acetobacter farinalis]
MPGTAFPSGGTNSTVANYDSSQNGWTLGLNNGTIAAGTGITNTASGSLNFTNVAGNDLIHGDLTNSGTVSATPTSGNATYTFGDNASTLTQTGGTIDIDGSSETGPANLTLNYATISNDANSAIDYTASTVQGGNFNAPNVTSLTNSGSISLTGNSPQKPLNVTLGNNRGDFSNSGSFTVNDAQGRAGDKVLLNFATLENNAAGNIVINASANAQIQANQLINLTNAGTIDLTGPAGQAIQSTWGNGHGDFNNTGNFSLDDSSATSGNANVQLNFQSIDNSNNLSVKVTSGSQITIQTAAPTAQDANGGLTNSGTLDLESTAPAKGPVNTQIKINGNNNAPINNTGTIVVSNAQLVVQTDATGAGGQWNLTNSNVDLQAKPTSGTSYNGQTFNLSGGDNVIKIDQGKVFGGAIRGFETGDQLNLGGVNGTPFYDSSTGILSIEDTNGNTLTTIDMGKGYTAADFSDNGGIVTYSGGVAPCFLAGSMIRTPAGDIAVEDIKIGDQILAFDWKNNQDVVRPVVWIGKVSAKVRAGLPADEAGWPVRVLKDAISDGVPYKDMLITAEHCLFFEGRFVPVRMLVNGVSIFYDKSITSYDYYHVETEEHSVITADGMLTESYLDTGNRSSFRQEGKVATLRATGTRSWSHDAAAPLCVERSFVEPLFRYLETREDQVEGCQTPAMDAVQTTQDPGLHLVMSTGAVIRPIRHQGQDYSFMLPAGVDSVRIVSRVSRPSEVIGPFVDDRRSLGVAVGAICFTDSNQRHQITTHLDGGVSEGWHDAAGNSDYVWTKGNALLPLAAQTGGAMGMLTITAVPAEQYSVAPVQAPSALRQSA